MAFNQVPSEDQIVPALLEATEEAGLTTQDLLTQAYAVFNLLSHKHNLMNILLVRTMTGEKPAFETNGVATNAAYAFAIALTRSVDELFPKPESAWTMWSGLRDLERDDPAVAYAAYERNQIVLKALEDMKTTDSLGVEVLKRRYGIGIPEERSQTLEEIGQEFSLNKAQVQRIELRTLLIMQNPKHSYKLKPFADF